MAATTSPGSLFIMKAKNDPMRNRIQSWHWGCIVEIYTSPKDSPRWIHNRGLLSEPCNVAGCKRHIDAGDWYVRHPFLGVVCRACAATFGAVR